MQTPPFFIAGGAGAYPVTARGADGGTGVALVEIYDAHGVEKLVPNL
jgi:hypothetical protein